MTMEEPSASSSADSWLERHDRIEKLDLELAVGGHVEVGQIAGVRAFGVHHAMLGLVGIEVRAGRLEIRRLAFADRVNVEGMHAGRAAVERKSIRVRRSACR